MWPRYLPAIPDGLDPRNVCLAGAAARAALGDRRMHLAPELIAVGTADVLSAQSSALRRDATRGGRLIGAGWHVWPAPDGLSAALANRLVPADAVGVDARGKVIDPLGGVAAWRAGRVGIERSGQSVERAPALLLTLPAVASELGARLSPDTESQLAEHSGLVMRVDRAVQRDALTRLLTGRRPDEALKLLARARVLNFVLPEVVALIDFHRSSRHHHKDVWAHTCQVVRQTLPRPQLRWAALLHDVGKVYTRGYGPGRTVQFLRHDELGALIFEGIATRLALPAAFAETVHALVLHHLRANLYSPEWSDSAVRRFAIDIGPLTEDLIALSRADCTTGRRARRREAMRNLYQLRERITSVQAADAARRPAVPKGLGRAIIDRLGVSPGPGVGELRRACEAAVRSGVLPEAPQIDDCIAWIAAVGLAS